MSDLTAREADVRDVVADVCRRVSPAPAYLIKDRALRDYGHRYDGVDRALTSLVEKGLLVKPRRGFYVIGARP